MFKNLVHLTLLTLLWKRYKRLIISTLILFVYFWLVGKLHEDYVNYVELNQDQQYLATSFFIKWLALIIGALVYLLINILVFRGRQAADTPVGKPEARSADSGTASKDSDPFAQIRQRRKLRSRADFIIEKKRK